MLGHGCTYEFINPFVEVIIRLPDPFVLREKVRRLPVCSRAGVHGASCWWLYVPGWGMGGAGGFARVPVRPPLGWSALLGVQASRALLPDLGPGTLKHTGVLPDAGDPRSKP